MPLKHFTETLLIWALAVVTIVTGILVWSLPPLPIGLLPALLVLSLTVAYPVGLYRLLKNNRADYLFRVLHLAPAAIVALWLLLQMAAIRLPIAGTVIGFYTWAWTLPAVLVTLVLLALFSFHVLRRRVPRVSGLAALFGVFLLFAVWSQSHSEWRGQLAARLWSSGSADSSLSTTGSQIAVVPATQSSVSSVPWGSRLENDLKNAKKGMTPGKVQKNPGHLPSAGPELDFLVVTFVASYCGSLHLKTRKRTILNNTQDHISSSTKI